MIWTISSVGQSYRLITGRSQVRVLDGPPRITKIEPVRVSVLVSSFFGGLSRLTRPSFVAEPQSQVRISHSKIDKLACQAQSVEILTLAVKILDLDYLLSLTAVRVFSSCTYMSDANLQCDKHTPQCQMIQNLLQYLKNLLKCDILILRHS